MPTAFQSERPNGAPQVLQAPQGKISPWLGSAWNKSASVNARGRTCIARTLFEAMSPVTARVTPPQHTHEHTKGHKSMHIPGPSCSHTTCSTRRIYSDADPPKFWNLSYCNLCTLSQVYHIIII